VGNNSGVSQMMDEFLKSLGFTSVVARSQYTDHRSWVNLESGEFICFDRNQWHWSMFSAVAQDWPIFHYKRFKHLIKGNPNG
jgi:hypothetical protein